MSKGYSSNKRYLHRLKLPSQQPENDIPIVKKVCLRFHISLCKAFSKAEFQELTQEYHISLWGAVFAYKND